MRGVGRRADMLMAVMGLSLTLCATYARAQKCQIGTCRCQNVTEAAATKTKEGHEWSRIMVGPNAPGTECNGSNAIAIKGMFVTCSGMQTKEGTGCYPPDIARFWEKSGPHEKARAAGTYFESSPLYRTATGKWLIPGGTELTDCKDNVWPFQTKGAEWEVKQDLKYQKRACNARSPPCPGSQYPKTPPTRYADRGKCTARHVVCDTAYIGGTCKNAALNCVQNSTLLANNTDFSNTYLKIGETELLTSGDGNNVTDKDVNRKFTIASLHDGSSAKSFCDCGYWVGSPWAGAYYEASPPTVTQDIVCKKRSRKCASDAQYAVEMGDRTHDLKCKDVTPCPAGMERSVPARGCLYDTDKNPRKNAERAAACKTEPNKMPRDGGCAWNKDFGGKTKYSTAGGDGPAKGTGNTTTLVKLQINCTIMAALKTEGCYFPTTNGNVTDINAAREPINNDCAFKDDFRDWMKNSLNLSDARMVSIEGGVSGTGFAYSCADKDCVDYSVCFMFARVPGSANDAVLDMVKNGTLFIPLTKAATNPKTGAVFAAGWALNPTGFSISWISPPPPIPTEVPTETPTMSPTSLPTHTHMFALPDADCMLSALQDRMDIVGQACCTTASTCSATHSVPSACEVDCAIAYVPFYKSCNHTINTMFDTSDDDVIYDGKAANLVKLETECLSRKASLFTPKITSLLENKCSVDVSNIFAKGSTSPASACVDQDDVLRAMSGSTCAQAKAGGACHFFKKQCGCACAPSSASVSIAHRRTLFAANIEASRCNTADFHARLATVQTKCCAAEGTTSCGNTPTNCNFECSRVAPTFYEDCGKILTKLVPDQLGAIKALVDTCARIPAQAMIDALVGAQCKTVGSGLGSGAGSGTWAGQ